MIGMDGGGGLKKRKGKERMDWNVRMFLDSYFNLTKCIVDFWEMKIFSHS